MPGERQGIASVSLRTPRTTAWDQCKAIHSDPFRSFAGPPWNAGKRTLNVGVDRHAPARPRETYASARGSRRLACACPRRTTY